jgi:alpha-L-fucosidase
LGIPDENILIKNMGTSVSTDKISKIEMLGSNENIKWNQSAESLNIKKPVTIPNEIAIVFKIYQK